MRWSRNAAHYCDHGFVNQHVAKLVVLHAWGAFFGAALTDVADGLFDLLYVQPMSALQIPDNSVIGDVDFGIAHLAGPDFPLAARTRWPSVFMTKIHCFGERGSGVSNRRFSIVPTTAQKSGPGCVDNFCRISN